MDRKKEQQIYGNPCHHFRFYQLTCDRLVIAPQEALFLDNSLTCVRAAQQLGMHGIHFKNSDQALADLQAFLTQNKDVL